MAVSAASQASQFTELQRFRQFWLWLLMGVTTVPVLGYFGVLLIGHFALGKTWVGPSDTGLAAISVVAIGLPLAALALLYFVALVTEVTDDGVRIRFSPVYDREIPFDEIEWQEVDKYSPLSEYGGWGIRWSRKNAMAFNVSGDRGVRLRLTRGRSVLIGSADAKRLSAEIRTRMGG